MPKPVSSSYLVFSQTLTKDILCCVTKRNKNVKRQIDALGILQPCALNDLDMENAFLFLFYINASCLFAQAFDSIPLKFTPSYGKEVLHLQDSSFNSNDKDGIEISVFILLKTIFSTFNLAKTNQIMTPEKKAVWISEEMKNCFSTLLVKR